jgi:hypothetical protein
MNTELREVEVKYIDQLRTSGNRLQIVAPITLT